jgi:hypothetical protein
MKDTHRWTCWRESSDDYKESLGFERDVVSCLYENELIGGYYFINLRTSEIHLFYNLQLFYWHFLEILWVFIFLVLYFS